MGLFRRRERSAEEVESKVADLALRDSSDALYNDQREAERSVKQAANALRDAERDRTKRIEAAEKHLAAVSSNSQIARVGGIFSPKAELRDITVKVPEGEFPLEPSIRARVEATGTKHQKRDTRELYLLIEADGWASTVKLDPDSDGHPARQFAQTLNVRAKSISKIHDERAANIEAAERQFAVQRADRNAVLTAHARLVTVTQDAETRLRGPRALVEMNLERVEPDTRAAKKARDTLDKAVLQQPPAFEAAPEVGTPALTPAADPLWLASPQASPASDPANPEFRPDRSSLGGDAPDVFEQIRKLGELREAGVLTQEEFDAKKAELLARL